MFSVGSWSSIPNVPTLRAYSGAAEANGKIYVVGGRYGNALNIVEEYNPVTNSWTSKASMPKARYGLGVVAVNGKIYAIGGRDNNYNSLNRVEEYNPVLNTWIVKANMPTGRSLSFMLKIIMAYLLLSVLKYR